MKFQQNFYYTLYRVSDKKDSKNMLLQSIYPSSRFGSSSMIIESGAISRDKKKIYKSFDDWYCEGYNDLSIKTLDIEHYLLEKANKIVFDRNQDFEFKTLFSGFDSFTKETAYQNRYGNDYNSYCKYVFALFPPEFWLNLLIRKSDDFCKNYLINPFDFPDYQDLNFLDNTKDFQLIIKSNIYRISYHYFSSIYDRFFKTNLIRFLVANEIIIPDRKYSLRRKRVFDRCIALAEVCKKKNRPLSFITLTMSPKWNLSQKEFSKMFNEWVTELNRHKFTDKNLSYIRVCEFTKIGTLHFHLLSDLHYRKKRVFRKAILLWFRVLANHGVPIYASLSKEGKRTEDKIAVSCLEKYGEVIRCWDKESKQFRYFDRELNRRFVSEDLFNCEDSFSFGDIEHSITIERVPVNDISHVIHYLVKYLGKNSVSKDDFGEVFKPFSEVYPVTCSIDVANFFTSVPSYMVNKTNVVAKEVIERCIRDQIIKESIVLEKTNDFSCNDVCFFGKMFTFEAKFFEKHGLLSPNIVIQDLNTLVFDYFNETSSKYINQRFTAPDKDISQVKKHLRVQLE